MYFPQASIYFCRLPTAFINFHKLLKLPVTCISFQRLPSTFMNELPYISSIYFHRFPQSSLHIFPHVDFRRIPSTSTAASIYFLHRLPPTPIDFHERPYLSFTDFHLLPYLLLLASIYIHELPAASIHSHELFDHQRFPRHISIKRQRAHDSSTGFYILASASFLRSNHCLPSLTLALNLTLTPTRRRLGWCASGKL